jgi:alkanesulfonate monooxygenase SsuD/methylene tetrahydromethanopterin reductase-like flavin-dependent oxidoreductase (luciferase family)
VFFLPKYADELVGHLAAGRAKAGKSMAGFDVVPTVPLSIGTDVAACAAPVRPYTALYVGGMGSREQNFYNALATRMGFGAAAEKVQELFLRREYDAAAAAVPDELVDGTSLLGPPERIAERMAEFAAAGVTTLTVVPYGNTIEERLHALEVAVRAAEAAGLNP